MHREQFVLEYINFLPEDMVWEISQNIPNVYFVFTNKQNYFLYHHDLKPKIKNYEQYIRNTLRRDNSFVFNQIMRENHQIWFDCKHVYYKNKIFNNYIYFLLHYCIENESTNCRTLFLDFLRKEFGLCQNQHKKNIVRNIRWKT
jgi:hypothetical protein